MCIEQHTEPFNRGNRNMDLFCCICTHCVSSLPGCEKLCPVMSMHLLYSFALMSLMSLLLWCSGCGGGVVAAPAWLNAKIFSSQDFLANFCGPRRQQSEYRDAYLSSKGQHYGVTTQQRSNINTTCTFSTAEYGVML
jgi:hypothetical protein